MLRAWFNSAHARMQGCLQKGRVVSLPYKALRLAHVVDLAAKSQFAESCSQNWCSRCFKIAVPIMAQKKKLWFWWQTISNNYIWSNFSDFTPSTQKVHKEEKFPYFRKTQAGEALKFCKVFHEHQTFQTKITHTMIRVVSAGIFPKISQSVRQLKWDRQWSAVANFPIFWGFDWFPILFWPESLHLVPHVVHHANQLAVGETNPAHVGIRPLKCNEASKPDVACLQPAHEEIFEDQTCEITNFCSHLSTAQRIALLHYILEDTWSFWSCEVVKHKWNKRMDQFWEGMFYSWGCELLDLDLTWKDHAGQTKPRAIDRFWALRGDNICLKCSILWRNEDSLIDQARKKTSRVTTSN